MGWIEGGVLINSGIHLVVFFKIGAEKGVGVSDCFRCYPIEVVEGYGRIYQDFLLAMVTQEEGSGVLHTDYPPWMIFFDCLPFTHSRRVQWEAETARERSRTKSKETCEVFQ